MTTRAKNLMKSYGWQMLQDCGANSRTKQQPSKRDKAKDPHRQRRNWRKELD